MKKRIKAIFNKIYFVHQLKNINIFKKFDFISYDTIRNWFQNNISRLIVKELSFTIRYTDKPVMAELEVSIEIMKEFE